MDNKISKTIKSMFNNIEVVDEKEVICLCCKKKYTISGTRDNYDYYFDSNYYLPEKYCSLKCSKSDYNNYRLRRRKEEHIDYAESIGVGKRHSVNTFDNFDGEEKTLAKKYLDNIQVENVLIQSQNTGNGKTHLAVASLKYFGQKNIGKHQFINFTNLMMKIKSTFESLEYSEIDIIKKYVNYEMLVIDDIGADKVSDYNKQVLYLILNDRYESLKPTIATTNLSSIEIEQAYGRRVLSRLISGNVIILNGKDRRGNK